MRSTFLVCTWLLTCVMAAPMEARSESPIEFDLPPTAPAQSTQHDNPSLVTIEFNLSSMVGAAHRLKVDQWMIRCQPRDPRVMLVDYSPRTETSSQLAGSIQVKTTDESSKAFGVSLDGGYGHLATGHAGADNIDKQIKTLQYDRIAPQQVVIASGTIDRGRGVYFKLRSTEQQVLEGEKRFSLTLRVPENWRGSLVDVSVEAQVEKRSFYPWGPWDRETKTISSRHFVVAVYRLGDEQAQRMAEALADAERALRDLNRGLQPSHLTVSLPAVFRQVASTFDSGNPKENWLQRLLTEQADPHLDEQIRELPMNVRVAVLDYAERREAFCRSL
jgi:hypothetical protein